MAAAAVSAMSHTRGRCASCARVMVAVGEEEEVEDEEMVVVVVVGSVAGWRRWWR